LRDAAKSRRKRHRENRQRHQHLDQREPGETAHQRGEGALTATRLSGSAMSRARHSAE
jgi:hypothetical protein